MQRYAIEEAYESTFLNFPFELNKVSVSKTFVMA